VGRLRRHGSPGAGHDAAEAAAGGGAQVGPFIHALQ